MHPSTSRPVHGPDPAVGRPEERAGIITADAGVAQLVEQLICNQQVVGSNPSASSTKTKGYDYIRRNTLSL